MQAARLRASRFPSGPLAGGASRALPLTFAFSVGGAACQGSDQASTERAPASASEATASAPVGPVSVDPAAVEALANFVPSPPPDLEQRGVPRADDGSFVLVAAGGVELRFDPAPTPTPMLALARCADWLMQCYEKVGPNMDTCMAGVPRCRTERPWEEAAACCPLGCADEYGERRRDADELAAFLGVFGAQLSCIPEYDRWLRGEWP